jgi:hypothetical protein
VLTINVVFVSVMFCVIALVRRDIFVDVRWG